ncbi:MAG: SPOR domain-containing protein [Clostridiales bacterium]|nr:SPOR domain-containing protein [Clostridiales bacterium]
MQEQKKVYPSGHAPGKWMSYLLLLIAGIVFLSGLLASRSPAGNVSPLPTATPFPLDESFDETITAVEWTLPEVQWYALQLGAFEDEASAKDFAYQFQNRGAAGYLWQDQRYRVLAAVYPTEEDARSVREQISQRHEVDSYLFHIKLPPIAVSIQGMRGQIEILQAAFLHADDLILSLQQLGIASDRSELSAEEMRLKLLTLRDQTSLVSLRMQQRFPLPRDPSVECLLTLLDDYAGFCDSIEDDLSSVSFGAQLKYQTIRSLNLLKQVYDILGNT